MSTQRPCSSVRHSTPDCGKTDTPTRVTPDVGTAQNRYPNPMVMVVSVSWSPFAITMSARTSGLT